MTVGDLIQKLQNELRTGKIQGHDMVAVATWERDGWHYFYFNDYGGDMPRARTNPKDENKAIVSIGHFDRCSARDVTEFFKADGKQ